MNLEKQRKLLESKFPVGSKFVPVKDVQEDEDGCNSNPGFNSDMRDLLGETLTVVEIYVGKSRNVVFVRCNSFCWRASWIAPHCVCPSIQLARTGCTCECLKREKIKVA